MASGQKIQQTENLPYLGLTFDSKMAWSTNTQLKIQKAKRLIGALNHRFGKFLSKSQFLSIVTQKVLPVCLYGMPVCYPRLQGDQDRLQRLQDYCSRVVSKDFILPPAQILWNLNLPSIQQIIAQRRVVLARSYVRKWRYLPENTIGPLRNPVRLRRRYNDQAYQTREPTALRTRDSALEVILKLWSVIPNRWLWLSKRKFKEQLLLHGYNGEMRA